MKKVLLPGGASMEWDPETGTATTRYPDGGYSACPVVEEDHEHATALGISPERARLEHEVFHHLAGIYVFGRPTSLVIYRDAHGKAHDDDSKFEEWITAAMNYHHHGSMEKDFGALNWLRGQGVDTDFIHGIARTILEDDEVDVFKVGRS